MLAAIALCLATTIILKMQLRGDPAREAPTGQRGRPWLMLVTLIPTLWLLTVTFTAGYEKIFNNDPRIGFVAQAKKLDKEVPILAAALESAKAAGNAVATATADKALKGNRTLHFNNLLDAIVAGIFLVLVSLIVLFSVREWILLLARKKLAELKETPPTWLPDYLVAEGKPLRLLGLFTLALALARELTGEAQMDRVQNSAASGCSCHDEHPVAGMVPTLKQPQPGGPDRTKAFVETLEHRFKGIRRCC
jgi:carbon starvation protein